MGKKVDTSGAIVGRYELGRMTPSIEVARKFAKLFGVTLDYLIGEQDMPAILKVREMLDRWQNLEELPAEDKDHIIYLVDGLIRDAKARKTYKSN
ncbi:MAG: helix-turn-helix transcriptional regulator [Dehalococcoidia bacterium]